MKTIYLALALLVGAAALAQSSHPVRSYTKKSGTYVAPHRQTNPDKTQRNNYSAKGNVNPYTGKPGTKTPKK
jgi:hypothetical protein